MSASCSWDIKWCLCREIVTQRKYLFVVMLPLIDFLATPFCGKKQQRACAALLNTTLLNSFEAQPQSHTNPR